MAHYRKLKMMRLTLPLFCALATLPSYAAAPEPAKQSAPAAVLDLRIEQLVPVLNGAMPLEDYFEPAFLAAVPPDQFNALTAKLIADYGQPVRIAEVKKAGIGAATVTVEFERALGTLEIRVNDTPGAKVNTLFTKGFVPTGDTLEKVQAEFTALSGSAGFGVEDVSELNRARALAGLNPAKQYAIGSTFKLYILAELAAQVEAGERKWTDVVPLSHRVMSSAGTANWPKDSPVTLQSLATWMISVSDNSATDTLLAVLGRSAVEQRLALIGHGDPDRALPLLSTSEAFALKSGQNAATRSQYLAADESGQRKLIENTPLAYDPNVANPFADGPAYIDSIEWFASPGDIARVFSHIRSIKDPTALNILTVNEGLGESVSSKFAYVGYKGGSEPGVMSMSYLLRTKDGRWLVVNGSVNDPKTEIDATKFAALMSRLVALYGS